MADQSKNSKKKVPHMKDLMKVISKKMSVDDADMLENLHVDSSELARDDEDTEWDCTEDARTFALNLYYYSPRAYEYVITHYDTCLPPVSTLRSWFVHKGGVPGFTEETLTAIGEKAKQAKNKIHCTLILQDFKEYHASVDYVDGEGYYGFHDVGTEMDIDCNNRASTALVMTVAAINASWNLPIGYFLLYGDSNEKLASLVTTAIFLLEQKEVVVTALTIEWSNYRNLPTALGCEVPKDMRNIKLVKFVSESHKDIIVIPDIRSRLNAILWFWEAAKEFKDSTGASIAWKYMKQWESAFKGESSKSKRIKREDSSGSDTYAITDRVNAILQNKDAFMSQENPGASATIKFLNYVDDLLNIFNLKSSDEPDQHRHVDGANKGIVIEKLKTICDYFADIKPPPNPMTNFVEFCIATKGVQEIIRLYLDEGVLENIPLNKTTSQPIEEIFAKIKHSSGTPKGRDVAARPFKTGYSKTLEELLSDFK